ncbi:MAG TPA: CsbD family protein [Variovorax sp.]|nr:CsbD family protein [Variovorax sp.]
MFNKTEGTLHHIAGRVQEAFGAATGDTATEAKGKVRRAAGDAQYGYGEIVEQLRESAVKNPIGTVAIVAGVFFVVGAIWSRR